MKSARKNVELKNRAEQYINEIEHSLEEGGDKVDANQKKQVKTRH